MVQAFKYLNENQIKQAKEFLSANYNLTDELDSYMEEVNMYYEEELAPYYIDFDEDKISGLLILDEVEDDIVYGRIFTKDLKFLQELKELFLSFDLSTIVFETPQELPQCSNLELDYAEYMMALQPKRREELLHHQGVGSLGQAKDISLVPVTEPDREFYETILKTQYDMPEEEAMERFDSLLSEEEMHGFTVYTDASKLVGIGSYYEGTSFVTLFDLTILPEYQNMGYGKAMLLNLLSEGNIGNKKCLLQVTSSNIPAVHLYREAGFEITQQQIFYDFKLS